MFFVQFPHPGGEHNPPGPVMPWNTGDHLRKFLLASGRYVDQADEVNGGELVFWGEWEAPSQVINRWPPSGRLPRALHHPYWTLPAGNGWRQNTDPWVFGERMLYSNCKRTLGPDNRPTSLQSLNRGSVICFGSAIDGEFCADTVLAIASAAPWTPADTTIERRAGRAFSACTADSLASGDGSYARTRLMLYQGATIEDPSRWDVQLRPGPALERGVSPVRPAASPAARPDLSSQYPERLRLQPAPASPGSPRRVGGNPAAGPHRRPRSRCPARYAAAPAR